MCQWLAWAPSPILLGGGARGVCTQVQAHELGDAIELGVAELRDGVGEVLLAPRWLLL